MPKKSKKPVLSSSSEEGEDLMSSNDSASESDLNQEIEIGTDETISDSSSAMSEEDPNVFPDGFDKDCLGGPSDRKYLDGLTEQEKEKIIYDRMCAREELMKKKKYTRKLKMQNKKNRRARRAARDKKRAARSKRQRKATNLQDSDDSDTQMDSKSNRNQRNNNKRANNLNFSDDSDTELSKNKKRKVSGGILKNKNNKNFDSYSSDEADESSDEDDWDGLTAAQREKKKKMKMLKEMQKKRRRQEKQRRKVPAKGGVGNRYLKLIVFFHTVCI